MGVQYFITNLNIIEELKVWKYEVENETSPIPPGCLCEPVEDLLGLFKAAGL